MLLVSLLSRTHVSFRVVQVTMFEVWVLRLKMVLYVFIFICFHFVWKAWRWRNRYPTSAGAHTKCPNRQGLGSDQNQELQVPLRSSSSLAGRHLLLPWGSAGARTWARHCDMGMNACIPRHVLPTMPNTCPLFYRDFFKEVAFSFLVYQVIPNLNGAG